jgi:AraC-like DNA-binding protein
MAIISDMFTKTISPAFSAPTATLDSIHPVTGDCPVEVFQWGGPQDHHVDGVAHAHAFDEILIFQQGGGRHLIDGKWYEVADASVHFIRVGAEHLLQRSDEAQGGTVLFLRDYIVQEPYLPFKQLFFMEANPVLQLPEQDFREVWVIYEQLLRETRRQHHYYRKQTILSWLNAFLVKVAEHYRQTYPVASEDAGTHPLAQAFRHTVTTHFKTQKSVEFYARSLFVSAKYLHEVSRKHLGKCPQEVIAECTVAEALAQLYAGTHSVKKIASELGFSDPAYFSRFLKKHTGRSPVEWQMAARS